MISPRGVKMNKVLAKKTAKKDAEKVAKEFREYVGLAFKELLLRIDDIYPEKKTKRSRQRGE